MILAMLSGGPIGTVEPFVASELPSMALAALFFFTLNGVLVATVIALARGFEVVSFVRSDVAFPDGVISLRLPSDAAGYARDLYASLRELEDRGCTSICIESVPSTREWDAIRDRLTRASA